MKILVVLSRVPYPLEKGDKLRAYNQIKELSKKHQVILFALNDSKLDPNALDELKKYCVAIHIVPIPKWRIYWNVFKAFFTGIPLQVGYFVSNKAKRSLEELVKRHQPDRMYFQLVRTAEYARLFPQIPKVLDYMDVFSKGMERRKLTSGGLLRPIFSMEQKRLLRYEAEVFSMFTACTIISEQDRALIDHPQKDKIHVVRNGVDLEFFKSRNGSKNMDVLFNGNMSYPPNIESSCYLVEQIMPIVWKSRPQTTVLISGAAPDKKVLALASDKVVVSGWVDDIRDNFERSRMLVAPMNLSIGLQNKLLEAMALKMPCITSSLANNALKAKNGEEIIVANSPAEYAAAILDLLENQSKTREMAERAYDFVWSNYNWSSSTAQLEQLFR